MTTTALKTGALWRVSPAQATRPVVPPVARRMTAGAAALARAVSAARAPLPLGIGDLALCFDPLVGVDFAAASAISLVVDERPLAVALSDPAHLALAEAVGAPLDGAARDPDVAALVVEAALEPAFDAVDTALGAPSRALSWAAAAPPPDLLWIGAALLTRGARLRAAFGCREADAAAFAAQLGRAPSLAANDARLALVCRLVFPRLAVSVDDVAALAVGDVLFDRLDWSDLRLSFGGASWRCQMNDEESVLIDAAAPAAADGGLEAAEVEIAFEIARVSVPLADARAAGPGHVFQLGRRVGAEVDVYVADRRFGRGRIVEVDGEMGVELIKLG